ncbi:hypothetical protein OQA88_8320 [Cercophora sp. LCS_1]
MAATQPPAPAPAPSSSSFASRRPHARTALPPFSLPPPPEYPRTTATAAADPLTPGAASNVAARQPTGSPYSTGSSPGHYSTASGTMLAHPQLHPARPSADTGPRLYSRPGPLSHPHGTPAASPPRKPLPGAPHQARPQHEKLPPISSLIPPPSVPAQYAPHPHPPGPNLPRPGYLAMPPVIKVCSPLLPLFATRRQHAHAKPWGPVPPPPPRDPRFYHEFAVPEYPIVRETSQQDRPFRCDMCSQSFSRNHDLKRHKRIHMAAKPFPCPTCHKSFSRRDALKRHSLVKACYKKSEAQPGEAAGKAEGKGGEGSLSPEAEGKDEETKEEKEEETTKDNSEEPRDSSSPDADERMSTS